MKQKVRTPIAAILLAVLAAISDIDIIVDLIKNLRFFSFRIHNIFFLLSDFTGDTIVIGFYIALCIVLFYKNRGTVLPALIAGLGIIKFMQFFSRMFNSDFMSILCYLLEIVFYLVMAVIVFVLSDQKLIKKDLSKLKNIVGKLSFIPVVAYYGLCAIIILVDFIVTIIRYEVFFGFGNMLFAELQLLLVSVIMLTLVLWLKNPYGKNEPVLTDSGVAEIPQEFTADPQVPFVALQTEAVAAEPQQEIQAETQGVDPVFEQLKRYKSMLDNGLITPEDYEAQKNRLLGL